MPRVAVVIPAYNAEATIDATVASVLAQTYTDFDLTVVDDGSTDRTAEIVAAFGDRLRLVRRENDGVSSARNQGAAVAGDTELVAFLDADDLWEPGMLARQVQALDGAPEAGMTFTAVTRVDSALRASMVQPAVARADFCRDLLLYSSVVTASSSCMLLRRAVFEAVGGYDRRFSQCADWDLLLRLSLTTAFVALDEPLVRYRQAPGNMSSDIGLLERDTFAVLDAFYAAGPPASYVGIRRRVYSNHWLILAGSYLHRGARGDALRCLAAALRTDPRNLGRPLGLPARRWRRRMRGDA